MFRVISKTHEQVVHVALLGLTDDFDDKDWYGIFRAMFKRVTEEDIESFLREYKGSKKQTEDVKKEYVKNKGDMGKILQCVIGFDAENEEELRELIWYLINKEEVEAYPKFVDEPASSREKRLKRARKEAKEANKLKEKLKREGRFSNQINTVMAVSAGTDDLFEAIRSKQQKRMDNVLNSLEEKYGGTDDGKTKKKKQR